MTSYFQMFRDWKDGVSIIILDTLEKVFGE